MSSRAMSASRSQPTSQRLAGHRWLLESPAARPASPRKPTSRMVGREKPRRFGVASSTDATAASLNPAARQRWQPDQRIGVLPESERWFTSSGTGGITWMVITTALQVGS